MHRDDAGEARVKFKIEGPEAAIAVTELPWFRRLLDQQRSFANGFSSLRDAAIIQSLEQIVRAWQNDARVGLPAGPTTAQALIDARLGQGTFRRSLEAKWSSACAVTGCTISGILRASHIKPWAASNDSERLDPENGLLLIAHVDGLFDKGLISFGKDGQMLLSKRISRRDRKYLRLPTSLRKGPSEQQCHFLEYHRVKIFEA
ncbi:HNH endonuclease [Bradyrhizobium sp. 197]|nr:HNH endonuclease [Bradyrhizobium sp. 197]